MSDRLADKAGLGIWRAGSHCVERQLGSKTLFQTCFLQNQVLFMAATGLHCCAWASSSRRESRLFIAVFSRWGAEDLGALTPVVAACRLSSHGA